MATKKLFNIRLKEGFCVPTGMTEDSLRALLNGLVVEVIDPSFESFVTSTHGSKVKIPFGPDGAWQGVKTQADGQSVTLIHGVGSGIHQLFEGSPNPLNPGPGWEINIELTKKLLKQGNDQQNWDGFLAKPVSVLNSL